MGAISPGPPPLPPLAEAFSSVSQIASALPHACLIALVGFLEAFTISKSLSLRHKQTLVIMLTSTAVLLLACAAFITYDVATFRRELVERVSVLADVAGNNCAAALDFNDQKVAEETLASSPRRTERLVAPSLARRAKKRICGCS